MNLRRIISTLSALMCLTALHGQFYNTGPMPDSVVWRQIRSPQLRMIFPEYFENEARRTMFYMDSVRSGIDWGLERGVMSVPVVMKTQNFASNGLSMWAPKRIEIVGIPPADTYATPWLKQLSVHEYRHSAQYTAMNCKTVRAFSCLFGEQALLLASGLMPFWWIEGDATDAETQASMFGRALQPSFTMHYRAVGDDMLKKKNVDRWFGGSYREYIPSHYELGYQMVSYANTARGRYAWNEIVEYGSKYPFLIFTTEIGERKFLKTSTRRLFRDTFTDLNDYWNSLPDAEDSSRRIPTPETSYTRYSYPIFTSDSTLIAVKSDFDRTARFVEVNTASAAEKVLLHVGTVQSRPTIVDNVLYWTEYSQNSFWEQQINSLLYSYDLENGTRTCHRGETRAMFPIGRGHVRYDYSGRYEIIYDGVTYPVDEGVSVHGLAADDGKLYYIALSDEGMSIEEIDTATSSRRTVKQPSHVTVSDLRAQNGRLYFGTIVSGKDEAAMLDLADGSEQLLSASRFGAFQPSPSLDGKRIAMTVYDRNGYHLAIDTLRDFGRVDYTPLPRNLVNPPRLKWSIPNVDSLRYTTSDSAVSQRERPSKPYSKVGHLLNFHSWAPIYFQPEQIMSGYLGTLMLGVSASSQNLLSSSVATVGYGYSLSGYHLAELNFRYDGLPVKLEADLLWTSQRNGYIRLYDDDNLAYWSVSGNHFGVARMSKPQPAPDRTGNYMKFYARAYLPAILEHSYHTRILVPSVEYNYIATPIFDTASGKYVSGQHVGVASLQYSDNLSRAKRDILPPFGFALRLSAGRLLGIEAPASWSLYGRMYLKGVAPHHAVTLIGGYAGLAGYGPLAYSLNVSGFVPRGSVTTALPVDNLFGSVEYQLPLWYPDAGISGIVFLKRIRLAAFADGSFFSVPSQTSAFGRDKIYSFGGSLYFDCSFLRLPEAADTAIRVSMYMPSDATKPIFGGGLQVDF